MLVFSVTVVSRGIRAKEISQTAKKLHKHHTKLPQLTPPDLAVDTLGAHSTCVETTATSTGSEMHLDLMALDAGRQTLKVCCHSLQLVNKTLRLSHIHQNLAAG